MLEAVEKRFGSTITPQAVQLLPDNGKDVPRRGRSSIYSLNFREFYQGT